jgi:3-hexulose-6-phosphate synthase/6-phospho-3-hexuloisomerase
MNFTNNHKKKLQVPQLQLALDFENLDDALSIAEQVAPYIDILEAGTPLIKSEGVNAVRILKERYPSKLICADLKTADAGYLEIRMAAKAKADIITILADAYEITIEEALRAAHEFHVEIMADLIMSRYPSKRLAEIIDLHYKDTKVQYALVHSGLDVQVSRRAPLLELESITPFQDKIRLAIAGGITFNDLSRLSGYPLSIIIIGGGITRAKNPKNTAKMIKQALIENF